MEETSNLALIHCLNREEKCLELSVDVIWELPEALEDLGDVRCVAFSPRLSGPCTAQSTFSLHPLVI